MNVSRIVAAVAAIVAVVAFTSPSNAQYFQSATARTQVIKASGRDSVILDRMTPFDLPKLVDSIKFTYHEPMPDSIMPRSAIVVGRISIQAETSEDVVDYLEKYARKMGADWIVSFDEPRAKLDKDKYRIYRSSALLLHVLDPNMIQQSDIAYNYYEQNHLVNYAAVESWFDSYGRHLGAKVDEPVQTDTKQDDPIQDAYNPDK